MGNNKAVKTTARRKKPNYIYSIISVSLVLFLLGLCGMVILHARQLINIFKEQINLIVEISPETTQTGSFELKETLKQYDFVKNESVIFIGKEEALENLKEDFGEAFTDLDLPNPLYDVITFNVQASYMHTDSLIHIKNELKQLKFVHDVYYQTGLVNIIAKNVEKIGFFALIIGFLFLIIAVTLIHSTIKLALYSNRFIIKNMELVGASWAFISRPYLTKSILHGFLSAVVAIIALFSILIPIQQDLPDLKALQDTSAFVMLSLALIVLGVFITASSTYYIVNKYLKMRLDDLY